MLFVYKMYRSNKISTSINDAGKEIIKLMKCPKCGNDMLTGEIGISSSSRDKLSEMDIKIRFREILQ